MAKSGRLSKDLTSYDPRSFPAFAVTVDIAVFTLTGRGLEVLLVKRGEPPFEGQWALPGGFVHENESLDAAAGSGRVVRIPVPAEAAPGMIDEFAMLVRYLPE